MFRPFLQLPEPGVNLVIDVSALFLPLCCSFHSEDGSWNIGVRGGFLLPFTSQTAAFITSRKDKSEMLACGVPSKTKSLISASCRQLQLRIVRFLSCCPDDFKLRPVPFPVTGIFLDGI